MRSIFLNKSISFALLLTFILLAQIVSGQNEVNLSVKKRETKKFVKLFVSIYGPSLKKIDSVGVDTTKKVLIGTTQEILSNGKYSFSFNITLENNTKLKFSDAILDTVVDAYEGISDNLNRLFKDFYSQKTLSKIDKTKNQYLKEPLTVQLLNNKNFIKRYYNRQWRTYNRPNRLTFGVFGGVNFSTAFISPFQYSDEAELKTQNRRTNEAYLPTGIFGFSAGYSRYSHGVDLFVQRTHYGVKYAQQQQIDWNTGYYTETAIDSLMTTSISIPVSQWGIRYRYSNYHRTVSPYVVAGFHVSFVNKSDITSLNLSKSRYLSTGCNLALGLNIHPIYALDIHIAPVMNISFNAVKGTALQTRFSSIALEAGIRYNFAIGCSKNKTLQTPSKTTNRKKIEKKSSKKNNKTPITKPEGQ